MKNKLHCGKATVITLIALLLFGCSSSLTREKPNLSDLQGIWAPDAATRKDMTERGEYDPVTQTKLILQSNGTLEIVNMPDWWESGLGESQKIFHSYTGTWELAEANGCWELAIYCQAMQTRFSLLGNASPYKIEIILGDPDSGNQMHFVRQVK